MILSMVLFGVVAVLSICLAVYVAFKAVKLESFGLGLFCFCLLLIAGSAIGYIYNLALRLN